MSKLIYCIRTCMGEKTIVSVAYECESILDKNQLTLLE